MINFGNVPASSVLPIFFDSYAGSTGASSTISGLAVTDIEIYKGTSMTQRSSDAGYVLLDTDGIDLDGITGINGFSIDLGDNTDAGFYAAGSFYNVVVSAITVDSQTVNFVAATFRIVQAENTAGVPVNDTVRWNNLATVELPLVPTTAGRKLDVSAGGEAGVDWANVGNPTTSLALTGTTIAVTQKVDVDTIKTNPVVNGGTITFPTNSTLASTTNITGGTITTVTTVTNQLTAAQIATGIWQDATAGDFTTASSIGKSLYTAGVVPGGTNGLFIAGTNAATTITTALTTTFTGNLTGSVGSVTGAVGSVTGAVGSVTGSVGSVTARVTANTDQLAGQTVTAAAGVTFPTSVASPTNITAGTLTTVTTATNLTTNNDKTGYALSATGSAALTESYAADGAAATLPQLLYMLLAVLSEFSISGTTLTAKKLDGSTTAGTFTLNDATSPTAITRAT